MFARIDVFMKNNFSRKENAKRIEAFPNMPTINH
jgi:hypothetical protein